MTRGHDSGDLACAGNCLAFDEAGCGDCPNTLIDGDEVCDGLNLGTATCSSATGGALPNGTLACAADCLTFDTTGCTI